MRPSTTGPCNASPTHRALGRSASNRPNTAGAAPSGRVRVKPAAAKWRCRVRADGVNPPCAARTTATCAAVRSGRSVFSATANSSTDAGVCAATRRGPGTNAVNPPAAVVPDPPVQTRPGDLHRHPERPRMSGSGDRPDQPAALLGTQTGVERVLDQAVPEQPHLLRPGPAGPVLVLLVRHDRRPFSLPGPPLPVFGPISTPHPVTARPQRACSCCA